MTATSINGHSHRQRRPTRFRFADGILAIEVPPGGQIRRQDGSFYAGHHRCDGRPEQNVPVPLLGDQRTVKSEPSENADMVVLGRVQNGVVVPEGDSALREGAVVTISYGELPAKQATVGRFSDPSASWCIRAGRGSVQLTGEHIA